ncbi:hypothetical protein V1289_004301 [Bradyrhizobium sp. AZCC 2289]|jgi:hypothetical protein
MAALPVAGTWLQTWLVTDFARHHKSLPAVAPALPPL